MAETKARVTVVKENTNGIRSIKVGFDKWTKKRLLAWENKKANQESQSRQFQQQGKVINLTQSTDHEQLGEAVSLSEQRKQFWKSRNRWESWKENKVIVFWRMTRIKFC